ncbi:signal peptidase II [Motilimonas eburnea]|uniref:signal peptidase II n=1 Tax=Motilimonas eburnea TaxID=1737488 RepID=UPI001E2EBDC0|nr:signal peptidase II [Motilimonas eburnea]MCE2571893.1 signal peptidase II [Motilimonas eburnea]
MKTKILLFLVVFLPLLGCDRLSKEQAVYLLKGQEPLSYMGGLFSLTYHENTGAMLSLGATMPDELRFLIYTVLVGIALLAGLAYVFYKPLDKYSLLIGMLFLSGGFGNLYDRAFNDGRVVDFMLIEFGPLKTGVFNVADIAIMLGFFGFIFLSTRWGKALQSKGNG